MTKAGVGVAQGQMRVLGNLVKLVLVVCAWSANAENTYKPAGFTNDPSSLQHKIKFPQVDGDFMVRLHCAATVDRRGRMHRSVCFSPTEQRQVFEDAVHAGTKRAKIRPAKVRGRSKRIRFQYRADFVQTEGKQFVRLYPSYGLDTEKFGDEYSSAQRYRNGSGNYCRYCGLDTQLWIRATIDEQGQPHAPEVVGGVGSERCKTHLMKSFLTGSYIPARHEGEFVESTYMEVFWRASSIKKRKRVTARPNSD